MNICECPTCQGVNGGKEERETNSPKERPVKEQCATCKHRWPACYSAIIIKENGDKKCLNWAPKGTQCSVYPVNTGKVIDAVNSAVEGANKLDHADLCAAHWDGFTGPLIDKVAEAVQAITQLGGEEEETDRAIDATVRAFKFMAMSHWLHGAKHERENKS